MATTRRHMQVPAARVWDTIADASTYAHWVVGADEVRFVEGAWPEVGAKLHHQVGVWPIHLRDNTQVLEVEVPTRLKLEARVRPLGRAHITLVVASAAQGAVVDMIEEPVSPAPLRAAAPLLEPLLRWRNVETLRRLEQCARERYSLR